MSGFSPSPFRRRLAAKLDEAGFASLTQRDVAAIQRAFVETLKEEVEARYKEERIPGEPPFDGVPYPNAHTPLVIPGLGSFKMKARPERRFAGVGGPVTKPPARRLAFTAKWEPLP